jgi:glycosyltransferase involved in cell wall biosynthesis
MFALYKASDVFLSMSEHEGFGLPFIECLIFDLPVIAYECCAVPFTLGDAGVLLKSKSVEYVAELVDIVAHHRELREKLIQGQRQRWQRFKKLKLEEVLKEKLRDLLE